MKFIDLFAGLGGFHVGLHNNGHECVFACEIDDKLRHLYHLNHGILPHDDIRTINEADIPEHDILCAGFPCQPFSLAGKKRGAKCPESGKLIDHVIRIANYHQPKYIFLENVPNILTIADGAFWAYMEESFAKIGYSLNYRIISPVDIGIPQNRKRIFIIASRNDIDMSNFVWPERKNFTDEKQGLMDILEDDDNVKLLESKKKNIIELWQQLLEKLDITSLGSISIVAPEFGANYPLDFHKLTLKDMGKYKGAYGKSLDGCKTWDELLKRMPSYALKQKNVPDWIKKSVVFSRGLYSHNKKVCNYWAQSLDKTNNSWQILEWRGNTLDLKINNHLVQFRASGIRILKLNIAPSLIAMTPTQVPIVAKKGRYITTKEASKLQNLHLLKNLPESSNAAFKALGNAVNAKIVELISKSLPRDFSF